jgi:hypothetical protein
MGIGACSKCGKCQAFRRRLKGWERATLDRESDAYWGNQKLADMLRMTQDSVKCTDCRDPFSLHYD